MEKDSDTRFGFGRYPFQSNVKRASATVPVNFLLFFFFQAEDGIRDSSVTGVQTCALPISPGEELAAAAGLAFCRRMTGAAAAHGADAAGGAPLDADAAIRDLLAQGFRILPGGIEGAGASGAEGGEIAGTSGMISGSAGSAGNAGMGGIGFWREHGLPSWTAPLMWRQDEPAAAGRPLLTSPPLSRPPRWGRPACPGRRPPRLPLPRR